MDAKKSKGLDYAMKLDIIRCAEQDKSKSSISDAFGISCSTLLRNRADIKAKAAEQSCSGACCMRIPASDIIEKALYAWFMDVNIKIISVDGPMLIEGAKCFAVVFQDNFCGRTGWVQ